MPNPTSGNERRTKIEERRPKSFNGSKSEVRAKLIRAGVKNLRTYGYPGCNDSNILTDRIYKAFFSSMLEDNRGRGHDAEIEALLAEIGSDNG